MISSLHFFRVEPHLSARRTLVGLFLFLFSTLAFASGGGGGGSSGSGRDPDQTNSSTPGDDVTSLPVVQDAAGLTLVGTLRELRALQLSLTGRGQLQVVRQGRGVVAVTFVGDYRLELDRGLLARTNVQFLFRGSGPFQGGVAQLTIGSSAPVALSPDRVPLPFGRLAASLRAIGSLVTLDAWGLRGQRAHLEAVYLTDRVVIAQRLN
ncbi:MAG: hypothetical protein EXS08_00175 [Planctomycetes bacterium]|nr:hypothetical protein [Planctomycetota bacterium]